MKRTARSYLSSGDRRSTDAASEAVVVAILRYETELQWVVYIEDAVVISH
jgi:hypothetical protein